VTADRKARYIGILATTPDNHFARFGLANAYFEEGSFDLAAAEYRRCLQAQSDWMAVHISLGRCLVKLGRHDEARQALGVAKDLAIKQGHSSPLDEIREILASIP